MRPILLYDGHCNLCIRITRILEFTNTQSVKLVPIQSAKQIKLKFNLADSELTNKIHFIVPGKGIYQGSDAVVQLAKFYPQLRLISVLFKTWVGKKAYSLISNNRYKLFGCNNACYISKYS